MDIKKALSKIFKIFVPVSLVVGSLIFSLSNVKDFKPVHADSGYSLSIDGGSTIAFTQQDPTTYTAEINENVRRYTEITFYDGSAPMLYSDTCYAEVSNTNNLFNDYDGSFLTKYGVSSAAVTLTIVDGEYIFTMGGTTESLKESSDINLVKGNYHERKLYCIGNGTNFATSYDETKMIFGVSSTAEPLYLTLQYVDGNIRLYVISLKKYIAAVVNNKVHLLDSPDIKSTQFPIRNDDFIQATQLGSVYYMSADGSSLAFGNCGSLSTRKRYYIYEVQETLNVKSDKTTFIFNKTKIQSVNLDETIEMNVCPDSCGECDYSNEIDYELSFNENDVGSLENRVLVFNDRGAVTVRVIFDSNIKKIPFFFVIREKDDLPASPIVINGSDNISNLGSEEELRAIYDYESDFAFIAQKFKKISSTYIGENNNSKATVFQNAMPLGNQSLKINKVEVKCSTATYMDCELSIDPNFNETALAIKSGSSTDGFTFTAPTGGNYAYFRLYNPETYLTTVALSISKITIYYSADLAPAYAKSFNEDFCAICELVVIGDKGLSDIISEWNIQKAAFIVLKEKSLDSANKLKVATYADEDQDIAEFALKYDYIYGKYHSSLDDFVERNPVKLSQGMNAYHSLSEKEDQSVLIIVVSASTILLISVSSLLVLLKKKKKH